MKIILFGIKVLFFLLFGLLQAANSHAETAVETGVNDVGSTALAESASLRKLAQQKDLRVGAAVEPHLLDDPQYSEILVREFNMLTPENAMKWERIHPKPFVYNWAPADRIVDFAAAHGMIVRGHTLVWGGQLPGWLTEGMWTRDQLIGILRDHIFSVVEHYRIRNPGVVIYWDVVNEPIGSDGRLHDNFWKKGIGPDYVEMAFKWAHEADPSAQLFLNDWRSYDETAWPVESAAIFERVKEWVQRGVPIHGVGYEMHLKDPKVDSHRFLNPEGFLDREIARYRTELNVKVHVTELDVALPVSGGIDKEDLLHQALLYRKVMRLAVNHSNCDAVVTWGLTDLHSWIPWFTKQSYGSALLFDEHYQPKLAYYAVLDELK